MGVFLMDRFPEIIAGMEPLAGAVVQKTAADVEAQAKTFAPVDTGYLRSSIQAQPTGALSAIVNCGADYGIYQEYGTSKMAAHPFMVPAAEVVRPGFLAAMARIVK